MSKVICQHCESEVSKSRISVHQKTKACREKQGLKPLAVVVHECEFCNAKVQNIYEHQKSFECRKYQPISSDCYFGICPFCEKDNQILVDRCEKDCGVKSCKLCRQAPDECPECLQELKEPELCEQDYINVLNEENEEIQHKLEEILYILGFKQLQVKKLKYHCEIKNTLKLVIREEFICQNYTVRNGEFEKELRSFIKRAFSNDQQYTIFQDVLIPNNEDAENVNYGKKMRQLPNLIAFRF